MTQIGQYLAKYININNYDTDSTQLNKLILIIMTQTVLS